MDTGHWIARPYRYADGGAHNPGRYEIFYQVNGDLWLSVGGAMVAFEGGVIAFLCHHRYQQWISRPIDAEREAGDTFVWRPTLRDALDELKRQWPEPAKILEARDAVAF